MIPFDKLTLIQSQYFDFGDRRLNVRAQLCIDTLQNSRCNEGFPHIFTDQYQLKAFYRLMNNPKVTPEKIVAGYQETLRHLLESVDTSTDASPKEYYHYQDTTYGSYLSRNKLDLGYLENKTDNGLVIHTALLTDSLFTPLGIAGQQLFLRDRADYQKGHLRKKRPIEQKETYKWIQTMEWSVSIQSQLNVKIIHVADREGDFKELFHFAFEHDLDFIIRVRHNRILPQANKKLWDHLRAEPAQVVIQRQLLDEHGKAYTANCAVVVKTIQANDIDKPLQVLYLRQLDNIKQTQATEWGLYTSLALDSKEQMIKVLDIYTHRWRTCEDFHKCLKTGCSIELRQFDSPHALTNTITMLSMVAVQLLRLRHLATLDNQSLDQVLNEDQAKLAQLLEDKYLKPVDKIHCQPNTVLWLVLLLGRMGGHQGIGQAGLPGWKTLWLGWNDFQKIMDGIILSKNFFNTT